MVQERSPAEVQADAKTEETRQFVRRVRRVTRRKFTPEEKVRIVLEGFRGEIGVSALCRREGIRPNVYYAWLKDFMQAGKARLQADTARDATQAEVEALKRERDQLKQLVAESGAVAASPRLPRAYRERNEQSLVSSEGGGRSPWRKSLWLTTLS